MTIRASFARLLPSILVLLLGAVFVTGALIVWRTLLPPPVTKSTRIDVIFKSTDPHIVFWQIVKAGAETAAKEFGVDVRIMGPQEEKDIRGQIAMVERVIHEHPAAIVLAADDHDALVPAAMSIRNAGIKLVTIDSGLRGGISSSFIATDNDAAAEKAGMLTAELIHDRGTVAIVSYVKGTTTAIQRELGVKKALARYPHIRVVGTYYSQDLEKEAYAITETLLRGTPRPSALVALNEVATVGAANAVAALHMKNKVSLVGFDSSPTEIRDLEAGVVKGIVLQKPFNIGYLGVAAAVRLLKGEPVAGRIDTGSLLVTKGNMYDRESQKLLFPLMNGRE